MSFETIEKIVRSMCVEVNERKAIPCNWRKLREKQLLYELAICVFSSQMIFEHAIAMVDRLSELGCFEKAFREQKILGSERRIAEHLALPLLFRGSDGKERLSRPRFRNRLSGMLAATFGNIYGRGNSLQKLLKNAQSPRMLRASLIEHVSGFGPKQASLFLRRIGYCSDFAVLDIHILDYLRLSRGVKINANRMIRLSAYEEVEKEFCEVAKEFGHSVGCVDLATWVTMRVAKREAFL